MKPAFSVLFFTVCAGAGSGLLVWLMMIQLYHGWALGAEIEQLQLLVGGSLGLALVTMGLLSSTLHLANPKNAWKAFNRFRTSWLSREGVFSVLFYPLFLGYAAAVHFADYQLRTMAIVFGFAAMVTALVTVYCTGMIYASLKPIRQWHNNLTTPLYLMFALVSGAVLMLTLHLALHGAVSKQLVIVCLALIIVCAVTKWLYFWFIGKPEGSTINTATGFSQANVRLLDSGHSSATFLTNEFMYEVSAGTVGTGRRLMAALVFVLPTILLVLSLKDSASISVYAAAVSMMLGLLLERWLFFAEAKHVVRLYHGDQRT